MARHRKVAKCILDVIEPGFARNQVGATYTALALAEAACCF
jgi:hypothetical protein